MLPDPIAQVTSYASLSRSHLPPHDTITALLSCTPFIDPPYAAKDKAAHGVFELSFASPCPSRAGVGNATIITGDKGWLQIATVKVDEKSVVRTTIHKVIHEPEREGETLTEEEEIIDETPRSIEAEISAFVDLLHGKDDGIGDPWKALFDVAVIQAALTSEGNAVDLQRLLRDG